MAGRLFKPRQLGYATRMIPVRARQFPCLAVLSLALAGCSGGLFNRSDPDTLEPEGGYAVLAPETRPLVGTLTDLTLDRTPGGAIVTATGETGTQGFWDVGLVRESGEDVPTTARVYTLRARPPVTAEGAPTAAPVGPARARTVSAGVFIGNTALGRLDRITVRAARGSRTLRP